MKTILLKPKEKVLLKGAVKYLLQSFKKITTAVSRLFSKKTLPLLGFILTSSTLAQAAYSHPPVASYKTPIAAHCPASPAGYWLTYDRHDGTPNGIMYMQLHQGVLSGSLVKVINKPGVSKIARCTKCTGSDHNRVLDGMQLVTHMQWSNDQYQGGHIFDPRSGNTYKGKIRLMHNPCRLQVRGFLGFSLFGATVYWTPLTEAQAKTLMKQRVG